MSLALDPSGASDAIFSSASSGTVTVSTTNASTLIIMVGCEATNATGVHRTVSSVTATGLTFTALGSVIAPKAYLDNSGAASAYNTLEVWAANAASPLSSVVVTVNLSGACDDAVLIGFGVNGTDTSTPADQNSSLAAIGAYAGGFTAPTVSGVSTSNANTFMMFAYQSTSNTDAGQPTGFTLIDYRNNGGGANNCELGCSYKIYSSTQSGDTYTSATATVNGWTCLAVALQAPSAALTLTGSAQLVMMRERILGWRKRRSGLFTPQPAWVMKKAA